MVFLWWQDAPLLALRWMGILHFAKDLLFVSLLFIITMIDWDFQIILDNMVYLGIAGGLFFSFFEHHFLEALLSAVGGALFFYAIRVVGEFIFLKEAMGEGDVKLAAMLGAFLGSQKLVIAIFLSFFIGIVIAIFLILFRLKERKDYIPFGPAMALGGFISAFWGTKLLMWYLSHLGFGG